MKEASRPAAHLDVLGTFRLRTPEGADASPRSVKARAMIAHLALAPGGTADRGRLSGLLWSESADAKTSLRQCIKETRRAFAAAGLTLLGADRFRVALDLGALRVDALEVKCLARSPICRDLEEMAALYQGDLLEGLPVRDPVFDEWLAIERARLRALVCHAVERGLRRCIEVTDREGLESLAEALLRLDPAHEEAHRALIRHYGERGDFAAAVRQYQACREALARGLDLQPSPETEALIIALRTGQHSRAIIRPPPAGRSAARSRDQLRTTLTIEPKALVLGDFADRGLAAAVAAQLREALARVGWLTVIDPAIFLAVHGLGPGLAGTASPRYAVFISVLRANTRIRLSAELKETATARVLWGQHYDRGFAEDVFELVDEVGARLAATLDREVHLAETMRVMRQPIDALSPHDFILKAIPLLFEMSVESFAEAGRLLQQALADDPHEPLAYAWRAFWGCVQLGQGWAEDASSARAEVDWHIDLHILPLLGAQTKLSRVDVAAFRDELLRTRSRALAKKVMTSLKAILRQAKMAHLAANVDAIETGGRHKKRLDVGRDIPSPAEVRTLLAAATGYMRPLLAVAVFCGLRMSEVRGLRWQDVDLAKRLLHVEQRADKWCVIGLLKSETSRRSIPMAPLVLNALREWRGDRILPGEALVFANGKGNVESLPNIWNRGLAPLQVACGVVDRHGKPKYGAHSLRHFFASWLIDQGFTVKRVSVLLGHSSPVVTLTIYSHLMPSEDDHAKFAAGETALVG